MGWARNRKIFRMPTDEEKRQLLRQLYGDATINNRLPLEIDDPDVAVLRSLSMLTVGRPTDFCDHRLPPSDILSWLRRAKMQDVKGTLVAALRRWHELRKEEREKRHR